MKKLVLFVLLSLSVVVCQAKKPQQVQQNTPQTPKYIFYFIGDGMGANDLLFTEMYHAELNGAIGYQPLCMTQFPVAGYVRTYSANSGITDSSAAGTCLATGTKTTNNTMGLDPDGNELVTVAEKLQAKGYGIGVTSSVAIVHATPAAFYANTPDRNNYYEIGVQLAESHFDFFGGAAPFFALSKTDSTAPSSYTKMIEHGYTIAHGYQEYLEKADETDKMVLIQAHEGLTDEYQGNGMIPYNIDRKEGDLSLVEITDAAINFLDKRHDKFFIMVEGGAIDWANHANDAATMLHDVEEFDAAIARAYEFYKAHPDETLIIITADHETGGFSLGRNGYWLKLSILQNQKASVAVISDRLKALDKTATWEDAKAIFTETLGFYDTVELTEAEDAELQKLWTASMNNQTEDVKTLYKSLSAVADKAVDMLAAKANISWTTKNHSAAPVPILAVGVGAEQFGGWLDSKEITPKILNLVK